MDSRQYLGLLQGKKCQVLEMIGPAAQKKVREDSLGTHLGCRQNGLGRNRGGLEKKTNSCSRKTHRRSFRERVSGLLKSART